MVKRAKNVGSLVIGRVFTTNSLRLACHNRIRLISGSLLPELCLPSLGDLVFTPLAMPQEISRMLNPRR